MSALFLPLFSALLLLVSPAYGSSEHAVAHAHNHANSSAAHHGGVIVGESASDKAVNFHRYSPMMATSGALKEGAVAALKSDGFKTIIDLRTPKEGVAAEQKKATASGLQYYNLPVAGEFPAAVLREQFKQLIEDPTNYPVLVHCASANRVGMVWAAYQLDQGVDYKTAVAQGRAIGMKPSKEQQLNDYYQSTKASAGEQ